MAKTTNKTAAPAATTTTTEDNFKVTFTDGTTKVVKESEIAALVDAGTVDTYEKTTDPLTDAPAVDPQADNEPAAGEQTQASEPAAPVAPGEKRTLEQALRDLHAAGVFASQSSINITTFGGGDGGVVGFQIGAAAFNVKPATFTVEGNTVTNAGQE